MSIREQNLSLLKYIPCTLTEGKEWYISYYCTYPDTNTLRRIRIKFNRIKNIKQRRIAAKRVIADIDTKLQQGWNPFIEETAPKIFTSIFLVIDKYLEIKKKEAEKDSLRSYHSYVKYLKNWLLQHKFNKDSYLSQFTVNTAAEIMLSIKEDSTKSIRTYNNYLQWFTTLFNWMISFRYLSKNPFLGIKKTPLKHVQKNRRTLTNAELLELHNYLTANNYINYLAICYLCYYCFIRPKEIALLKVKDIDIEKQTVYIDAQIAKNDHTSIRTIPDIALQYIKKLNLSANREYYLFSMDVNKQFVPGVKWAGEKEIARFWSDNIRSALGWSLELKFYSLKDTGITNMLASGVAANFVQGQADHSSLTITSKYAVSVNEEAKRKIKNLKNRF